MKPLVVFGTGQIAELAIHYFRTDSNRDIVGVTVDSEFLTGDRMSDVPVVPFEKIATEFPPSEVDLFIALSYRDRNQIRRERFLSGRELGYRFASYVSSRATVLNGDMIGENCFVLENNTVQPFVTIGDNTTLWSGNHIGHHSKIGSHVFISSHVVISGGVTVEDGCFVGVNATVRDRVTLGAQSVIGAGAIVMRSVPASAVLVPPATRARKSETL